MTARRSCYEAVERLARNDRPGAVINYFILATIAISVVVTVLETVPSLRQQYRTGIRALEFGASILFAIEYLMRLWIAPEYPGHRQSKGLKARMSYAFGVHGIIDGLVACPIFLEALFEQPAILVAFRICAILKLSRYSLAARSLLNVLSREQRALIGCLVILACATLISATGMFLIEGHIQPERFGTIPDAMWWSIVTLTTIGYGDVVPITAQGRMLATLTIVTGLIMIALPVGIIATAFAEEIHRRDFILTWSMVARVPLFSHMNASQIADVTQLLRTQDVQMGETIVRRGEPAHSMYFLAAGEVEINLKSAQGNRRIRVGAGHFFGEMAVLNRTIRSATITALSRSRLFILDAKDLHALISRDPGIRQHLEEVVANRLKETQEGDLTSDELTDR